MMQPLILDLEFNAVLVLDFYESFIWTERYALAGDFEIRTPINDELLANLKIGYYIYLEESDRLMIIETMEILTNSSDGNRIRITGRSLEMLLDRRIVWSQTMLDGYLDGQVKKLINNNIINPADTARKIPGFSYINTSDPTITAMKINSQYTGDNIYDVITNICSERGIGFKIIFDRTTNGFVFSLYSGTDRSADQTENEVVEFSPDFDNLLDSEYVYNNISYKTMGLVAGMDKAENRIRVPIFIDDITGLERRELYIDARDLQQDEDTSDAEYELILMQRGYEKLYDYQEVSSFDGKLETNTAYIFNRDYFLGDIVYVENEFGIGANCRITELIRSNSSSGYAEYPTFEMI